MSEIFQLYECGDVFQFTDPADSYQTWQGLQGPPGPQGPPGENGTGLYISGTVATVGDLPASADQSTMYNVGAEAPYELYMYDTEDGWISLGYLEGPQGPAGAAAGFGTPTATVDGNTGTPGVTVTASGPDTAKVFAFAFTNLKGAKGDTGAAGQNGTNGTDGTDGVSPGVTITSITGGHTVKITDKDHPSGQSFNVMDGQDGTDGAAATIAVGTVSGLPAGSTPTVTNSGTSSAAVFNFGIPAGATGATGATGPQGPTGPTGPGVASGGTTGQVLAKKSSTNYDTEWITPTVSGALYFQNVAVSATTGTIATISNASITADDVVVSMVFANPSAITTDVTWTTAAGSLTLTGTCTSATTVAVVLVRT